MKVIGETKTVIPGTQAALEWLNLQEKQLKHLCTIITSTYHGKLAKEEMWCQSCKERSKSDNNNVKSGREEEMEELVSKHIEHPERILQYFLGELLEIDTNYITGVKKVKQIIEKNLTREEKLLDKMKEHVGKTWVKQRKMMMEQGLTPPPKPSAESLVIVTDPLIVQLQERMSSVKRSIAEALVLHQKLIPKEKREEHGNMEVLYLNATM
jgi:hypothetical protein